jgi:RNA polymerase sigma-70 factor, ECF subfamily
MRSDLKRSVEITDAGPFPDMYRSHVAFIWPCLRRMGVREADIDDLCQETFVLAHRKISTFDGSSKLRTWLFGIAMRKAAEYRRSKRVRCEQLVDAVPESVAPAPQLAAIERRHARVLLDRILDGLDQDKRAVFVLYELEQLPMAEVAVMVDCPLQTAYSRLHAARGAIDAAIGRLRRQERVP